MAIYFTNQNHLSIWVSSNWNIIFDLKVLYIKKLLLPMEQSISAITQCYLHRIWGSQHQEIPTLVLRHLQNLSFHLGFFSTGRLSIILSFAFSLLTEYQNQVEKKSGKFTQDKLDCYTKKEDPKLLLWPKFW